MQQPVHLAEVRVCHGARSHVLYELHSEPFVSFWGLDQLQELILVDSERLADNHPLAPTPLGGQARVLASRGMQLLHSSGKRCVRLVIHVEIMPQCTDTAAQKHVRRL